MEKNKNYIGKIFVLLGLTCIITTLTDLCVVVLPPHLSNPEWVNKITTLIADKSIIPSIGVLFILAGLFIKKQYEGESKGILIKQQLVGAFSLLFGIGLMISTILYSLSVGTVESNQISFAKQKAEQAKIQIEKQVAKIKVQIPEEQQEKLKKEKNNQIQKLNVQLEQYIEAINKQSLKSKIRVLVNLVSFIIIFIFTGVFSFFTSLKQLKLLKFNKN